METLITLPLVLDLITQDHGCLHYPDFHGLEASWLNPLELKCSKQVRKVLFGGRKPYTRAAYVAKWKRFTIWCTQIRTLLMQAPLLLILEYLQQGLAASSIKVHFAAILAFHPGAVVHSVFATLMVGHSLKDLERLYPQVRQPILA